MTKKLSLSGIMTALTLVFLFGSSYIPTGKIALLALSSMCMLVTVCECGIKLAGVQFVAVSLLSLLLIPSKLQVFLYIGLVGYYPILKLHIESIKNVKLEWLVKIMFFSALLVVAFFVVKFLLLSYLSFGAILDFVVKNIILVVILAEVGFICYDYFLSFFARYFREVIQKRLNKGGK